MSGGDPGPGATGKVIELWQAPDRLWRWRYVEPSGDGRVLAFLSNKEYESREAALRSATTAYPEVTVREAGVAARGPTLAGRFAPARARDRLVQLGLVALAVAVLWPRRRRKVLAGGADTAVRTGRPGG
jgi:hypothetical protein